jgi:hypothetical protein
MRNSTFVVLSFLGLIFLAASLIWMPLPKPAEAPDSPGPVTVPPAIPIPGSENAPALARTDKSEPPISPLKFPTWPAPKMVIVATGEQYGYFEPCGCTGNQLGGMSRRAGLFEKLNSLGWQARGIDVGGISRRTGPQAQLKFETTLEAMRELKYVAL